MSFYKAAKNLASMGFFVFPLIERKKTPAISNYTECATDDSSDLGRFWLEPIMGVEHQYNVGIATSKFQTRKTGICGLIVVDVDNKDSKKGSETMLNLELAGFNFPKTFTTKTPTGGLHLIYKHNEPLKQGTDVLGPGLDIRSRGGYVVAPGSVVPAGQYTFIDNPIADAPSWLVKKLKANEKVEKRTIEAKIEVSQETAKKRTLDYLKKAPLAIQGDGGDHTTFQVSAKLKDFGVSIDNAFDLLADNWNTKCQPPWDLDELRRKIENAYSYGQNTIGADSPEADFTPVEKEDVENEILSPVKELNKTYGFIVLGGQSRILRRRSDRSIEYMRVQAFHDSLKAQQIQMGKSWKQLSEVWFKSPERANYDYVNLMPCQKAPPNVFNLWQGFMVEPLEKNEKPTPEMVEGVRIFKEHALDNVCKGSAELFSWLMGYFAHLIQKPYEKPLTALVFKGEKGVGKNALIDRVGKLIGAHYKTAPNKRYLVSNFNAHMANLLLFVLDEAVWSGDKQAEGALKDIITGNEHLIEPKGNEVYSTKNLTRIVLLSNEDWVVPATRDERRFAVFNVSSDRRGQNSYFKKMRILLDEKGGNRLLMREFLDFDLKTVDVNVAPITEGLLDQKLQTLNVVQSWLYSCLQEGVFINLPFNDKEWMTNVNRNDLRDACISFAKYRNVRSWLPDASAFGKDILKCIPKIKTKRVTINGERQRVYVFPKLAECRDLFEEFIGHKIIWEKIDDDIDLDCDIFK